MDRHLYELTVPLAAAVARRPELREGAAPDLLALLIAEYADDAAPNQQLARLVDAFDLDELDTGLLVVAAAPDLDARFGALYGLLSGCERMYSNVGLALELCGYGSLSATARSRLRATASLSGNRLISTDHDGPALLRSLRVPERVVAHLLGDDSPDVEIARLITDVPPRCDDRAEELAAGMRLGARVGHVRSRPGTTGTATACGAFELLGIGSLVLDLSRAPKAADQAELTALGIREAGLRGFGLVVTGRGGEVPAAVADITAPSPPVVVVDDFGWDASWLREPPMTVVATELSRPEREVLWSAALDPAAFPDRADVAWQNLLSLRIQPQDIAAATQAAILSASAAAGVVTVDRLRDAALAHGTVRLESAAIRTNPRATLADLVLNDANRSAVEELVAWARNREGVLEMGGLAGPGNKGAGLTAMFTGAPGTGKSLAAEAVAGELGLELYTVDLSLVIDKYIGETEKQLERVISEAENLNVVLFFDEADSLFGSRSSVSDAHDRYANQEVSYLLQRIERFEGLAILATNLRGNLDPAFTRRLHHVINFAEPDAATRRLLWEAHLRATPGGDPDDPLDLDWLAETVDLCGGVIRNIVMSAAFAAAAERASPAPDRPDWAVGMRHVLRAVEREYTKLARRPPAGLRRAPASL